LQEPREFATGIGGAFVGPTSLAAGDFNADGKIDLATTSTNSNSVSMLLGNGNGNFQTAQQFAAGNGPGSATASDVNGDGKLDLVVANPPSTSSPGVVSVLLGNGSGSLAGPISTITSATEGFPSSLVMADFNGDGRLDAAAANTGSNNVSVLLNDNHWTIRNYVGPSGGNWSTAGNWSPSGIPTASDLVTISGNSVNLSTSATVASLTLGGGASLVVGSGGTRVLRASALSIDLNSKLDLNDNALILDYTGASPASAVRDYLVSGRNGGAWNGSGITSSAAAAPRRALGYADNNTLATPRAIFVGQSVDSTSILIKFTYAGDADLDGDADGVDIGTWATHFTGELGGAGAKVWADGDWDYDGDVDGVDAGLWAQAFTGELGGGGLGSIDTQIPTRMGQRRLVNQFASELLVAGQRTAKAADLAIYF
jgi:hypothetical protein